MAEDEDQFEILNVRDVGRDEDDEPRRDFLPWDELGEEGAGVLFSVVAEGEEEKTDYGWSAPMICRVIILTGEYAGEIYQDVKVWKGGIRPKMEAAGPGKHVVGRFNIYTMGEGRRKTEHVGLDDGRRSDIALAHKALAKFRNEWGEVEPDTGSNGGRSNGRRRARDDEDERPARRTRRSSTLEDDVDERPRRAANGRARGKPIGNDEDEDEPPAKTTRTRRTRAAADDDDEPPARKSRATSTRTRKAATTVVEDEPTDDDEPPF